MAARLIRPGRGGSARTPAFARSRALALVIVLALALVVLALAGCGQARRGPTYPPAGATPIAAGSQTSAARAAIAAAVGPTGLQVVDATHPYRPPEGPWFAGAPRTVLELDAPGQGPVGYIVLYAFGSGADAAAAAQDQATYASSGAGRVYFPGGTHFTIQILGSAVAFLAWAPSTDDPRLAGVESALGALGAGVAVPR